MDHARVDVSFDKCFFYENLKELVKACSEFYHSSIEKVADTSDAHERRCQLSRWIRRFHQDCGTLTPYVEKAIDKLKDESCLFLMTAHQPNLFAYSGVLRKATLNHVLAEKLSENLNLPVVSFFGIADQDFTDDRWVKSALLPDAEKREGLLELRIDLSEKLMLNKVPKPPKQVLNNWQNKIKDWFNRKLISVERSLKSLGVKFSQKETDLPKNFEDFWRIIEESYEKAKTYSDFNAFVMSKIANIAWGYNTLFSRFSDCQQIFKREFCFLLSHFEEYSEFVKEATLSGEHSSEGVYQQECNTVPFWYHCDCGSKVRLIAEQEQQGSFVGVGECLRCRKGHRIDFSSRKDSGISGILHRISARSLSMPLIFFDGLKVCCYVGGLGGKAYLHQAKYVAECMGTTFPPVVVWRPKDIYLGVGQVEAIMTFKKLSGTFDLSQYSATEARMGEEIAGVKRKIDELELQKRELADHVEMKREEMIERMKALSVSQHEIRREVGFSSLSRNLKLLQNVKAVMHLYPCIVDYAVNVGLGSTSEQWIAFLKKDGSLSSTVRLRSDFDDFVRHIGPPFDIEGRR